MPRLAPLFWLALVLAPACTGPRWYHQESVVEQRHATVQVEKFKDGSAAVDQGFAHPAHVDAALLGPYLENLRYRSRKSGEAEPAFDPRIVPDLARGIARGLAAADSASRVRFVGVNPSRTLWVFASDRSTRGVAFVAPEGTLNLAFDVVDEELDAEEEDFDDPTRRTRTDAVFLLPEGTAAHLGSDGRVDPLWLMLPLALVGELPDPAKPEEPVPVLPPETEAAPLGEEAPVAPPAPELTPEQVLERLRHLEELYREGAISEAEFSRRRAELLKIPPR